MGDNGPTQPLRIDVTDEHAFRTEVVQHLQLLADRTACLSDLKRKVDKHETLVQVGKYAAVPVMGLMHATFKHFLHRLGW